MENSLCGSGVSVSCRVSGWAIVPWQSCLDIQEAYWILSAWRAGSAPSASPCAKPVQHLCGTGGCCLLCLSDGSDTAAKIFSLERAVSVSSSLKLNSLIGGLTANFVFILKQRTDFKNGFISASEEPRKFIAEICWAGVLFCGKTHTCNLRHTK